MCYMNLKQLDFQLTDLVLCFHVHFIENVANTYNTYVVVAAIEADCTFLFVLIGNIYMYVARRLVYIFGIVCYATSLLASQILVPKAVLKLPFYRTNTWLYLVVSNNVCSTFDRDFLSSGF